MGSRCPCCHIYIYIICITRPLSLSLSLSGAVLSLSVRRLCLYPLLPCIYLFIYIYISLSLSLSLSLCLLYVSLICLYLSLSDSLCRYFSLALSRYLTRLSLSRLCVCALSVSFLSLDYSQPLILLPLSQRPFDSVTCEHWEQYDRDSSTAHMLRVHAPQG